MAGGLRIGNPIIPFLFSLLKTTSGSCYTWTIPGSGGKMKKVERLIFSGLVVTMILLAACSGKSQTTVTTTTPTPTTTSTEEKTMKWSTPPAMTIDQNKTYNATVKTNYGDFTVQLFPKDAPLAVNNFVFLARQGFYDGVKFHRIVKDFMIQGGDPSGTGGGTPGYRFADEKITRDYIPGTLAMANSGTNTNGSQFFIMLADYTNKLPKNYTIFGIVSQGMDTVRKIGAVPVKANPQMGGEVSQPTVDVHIETITIEEK
jgi:cyclophilin family peptidyl-prolyl cis-trans isomerase